MRLFGLVSVLALAACGAPDAADQDTALPEQAEDKSSTEASSDGKDDAKAGKDKEAEKKPGSGESAEETKVTEELKNSVATDKADGNSKPVECTVGSAPGGWEYKGQCEYFILGGDSFTMVRTDGRPFNDNIIEVIIEADTPTQAGMSVRMSDGERPGFGPAYREAGESCWINDSLDVCWKDL